jgi:hypothetical protein
MMALFYSVNAALGLIIVIAICVLVSCGGHVLVHRTFSKAAFNEHNEVAGFVLAIVGVLYAVILGFITVVVWEHYEQTDLRARTEVDAATDVWRLSRHLPPPSAQRIRNDVDRYAISVYADEWRSMRNGGSPKTQGFIVSLIDDIASFDARGEQQGNVQSHLLDRVQMLADLRRERIADSGSGVPGILWLALLLGAATIACFIYLFGMKNFKVQLLLTGATAVMIGVAIGLIVELDYPFSGSVSITPERWVALSELIARTR